MRWIVMVGLVMLPLASTAAAQDQGFDWREEAAKWWSQYDPESFDQYGHHLWDHDWNGWAKKWKEGGENGCPWKGSWGGDGQGWGDWSKWRERGNKPEDGSGGWGRWRR